MKPLKIKKILFTENIFFLTFFIFQLVLLSVFSKFPAIIEQYYSNGCYPIISKLNRIIFGWIPFSVGDLIYISLSIYLLYWFYKNQKINWIEKVKHLFKILVIGYFIFHLLWAYNYYRMPLYEKMNLRTDYRQEELLQFTKRLIYTSNKLQFKLTHNVNKKVISPYKTTQIFRLAPLGYADLKNTHPFFDYTNSSIKSSLFSYPLTYMGFGGYLNPFTNEAQVNDMPPSYNLPAIVCHEMAHQIGYSSESECNFIGFLACTHNKNLFFQYAGYTYALRYCLAHIASKDQKELKSILSTIHPGVLKNFQESETFWSVHESMINTGFEIFYDHFLKLNQQKEGMQSYSKFINLLINYEKKSSF
ncbi:DUF3810 domain-containing protein [Flavobacterium columnare]|uniref:DUF3810 domain-containing protein n=1 Tax=Flavobacterium columnare TaxID=996 RepID=UPI000D19934F|nr:DUF3810 domain-containing protein [Flavobacterium columnare]MBF6656089.1 DUF3810 domain-containing protein [Flavobacterium columnare]MBF6658857.1 DUF3810 domain-containing protein [Flavobacterium columnare]PTD15464.1 DUF3810 domain-containing protein [Flavobacterium columnare]